MKDNVITVVFILVIVAMLILCGVLLYKDAGMAGICKGKGGVYVEQTCIKPSAVIELTTSKG